MSVYPVGIRVNLSPNNYGTVKADLKVVSTKSDSYLDELLPELCNNIVSKLPLADYRKFREVSTKYRDAETTPPLPDGYNQIEDSNKKYGELSLFRFGNERIVRAVKYDGRMFWPIEIKSMLSMNLNEIQPKTELYDLKQYLERNVIIGNHLTFIMDSYNQPQEEINSFNCANQIIQQYGLNIEMIYSNSDILSDHKVLLTKGVNTSFPAQLPNGDIVDSTPLGLAISSGNTKLAIELIKKGADVNTSIRYKSTNGDIGDSTPLGLAISSGKTELAIELIKKGADVNTSIKYKSTNGTMISRTPLGMAILKNQSAVAIELINKGANVNTSFPFKGPNGNIINITPLGMAIAKKQSKLAEIIIEKGGDVRASFQAIGANESIVNRTPLEMAILTNQSKLAKILLEQGANFETSMPVKLDNGRIVDRTPLEMARNKDMPEVIRLINAWSEKANFLFE